MLKFLIPAALLFTPLAIDASDFDTVLNTVVDNNYSIKFNDADRQTTIAELKAENTLEAPEFSYENLFGNNGIGDKRNFSISQSFDWPGVYAARNEAVKKSESAMLFLRESEILDLRMDVRLLLVNIIYTRQKLATTRKIVESLSELSASFKKAVEEGNETRLDYNKSVIEKIAAERELRTLEGEYAVLVSSLQVMNGGKDVDSLLEMLGSEYPAVSLNSLRPDIETLKMKDPAQAAATAALEAQKSLVKVENRSLFPGFSLSYLHEWEMGDTFNGFSISVSLPFISGKKKVKAARMKLRSLELDKEMSLIKLAGELKGEYENACSLKKLIDEYEDVVCGTSNIDLLKKALDGGQINFLTYMQEVNFFLAAHRDFHETLYLYNVSLAKLQRYN